MDWLVDWLMGLVATPNHPAGLLVILLSAGIEYVMPPFPGDTITLLGAVLITGYDWSLPLVFGAVMIGSLGGSYIAFRFGHRVRARRKRRAAEREKRRGRDPKAVAEPSAEERAAVDKLVDKFQQHGPIYLVLNRFLPGIRALFFVAAGMADMRTRQVMVYAAISAALWNAGVIALGSLLGANLDLMVDYVRRYTTVVWIVIGAVVVVVAVRYWLGHRKRSAPS